MRFDVIAQKIQSGLGDAGITVTLKPGEIITELANYRADIEGFGFWPWGPDYFDSNECDLGVVAFARCCEKYFITSLRHQNRPPTEAELDKARSGTALPRSRKPVQAQGGGLSLAGVGRRANAGDHLGETAHSERVFEYYDIIGRAGTPFKNGGRLTARQCRGSRSRCVTW